MKWHNMTGTRFRGWLNRQTGNWISGNGLRSPPFGFWVYFTVGDLDSCHIQNTLKVVGDLSCLMLKVLFVLFWTMLIFKKRIRIGIIIRLRWSSLEPGRHWKHSQCWGDCSVLPVLQRSPRTWDLKPTGHDWTIPSGRVWLVQLWKWWILAMQKNWSEKENLMITVAIRVH